MDWNYARNYGDLSWYFGLGTVIALARLLNPGVLSALAQASISEKADDSEPADTTSVLMVLMLDLFDTY